jgi:uncharacterized protein YbbC (DUF1343 family)
MKRTLLSLCFVALTTAWSQTPSVMTGIEVLRDRGFDILAGKRVGLITNPTGVDASLRSTVDILASAKAVKLVALFGPEHGVRGDYAAGDTVGAMTDPKTGIPVYSLYGKTRKPTSEMLKGVDILVYDIQDIGCRGYTYISTMGLAMESAAAARIPFVVLDRPNPLGGLKVEGNVVEEGFFSFVSKYPIPYVYGLTCGELARLLRNEKMLNGAVQCSLLVVPMKGWKRSMKFADTGLPWVPTSPHVPQETTPAYAVATGIIGELGVISAGIGYTFPFRTFAAPWIDPNKLADALNAQKLPGVLFRPITFKPFYGTMKDSTLSGVQIYITNELRADLLGLEFHLLEVHHRLYPDRNPFTLADSSRLKVFDRVIGTDKVRKAFTGRMRFADVEGYLNKDRINFRKISGRYFLYK